MSILLLFYSMLFYYYFYSIMYYIQFGIKVGMRLLLLLTHYWLYFSARVDWKRSAWLFQKPHVHFRVWSF